MADWTPGPDGRPILVLETWEQRDRSANVSQYSTAPLQFSPIPNAPAVYTHIGHDLQYGAGRRNGRTVRCWIIHTTESPSFDGSMAYNARRPETVSATVYAGQEGQLGYGVPEFDRAWTTGRWNDEALTIEVCGRAAWTADRWRQNPKQIRALIDLLADWAVRFQLPPTWLTADRFAQGASRNGESPRQGSLRGGIDHWEANQAAIALGHSATKYNHHDIGPGLREVLFDDILPAVRSRIDVTPTGVIMANTVTDPSADDLAQVIQFEGVFTIIRDQRDGWRPLIDASEDDEARESDADGDGIPAESDANDPAFIFVPRSQLRGSRAFIGWVAGRCDAATQAWIMGRYAKASGDNS